MPHPSLHPVAAASLCLALLCGSSAIAAPVTASFFGAITSLRGGNDGRLSSDFPVGTAVSAAVSFDNSLPGVMLEQPAVIVPAAGTLRFGTTVYTVTGIRASGRSVFGTPTVPDFWSLFILATGPSTDDGDIFQGFLWYLNRDLDGFYGPAPTVPLQAAWVEATHATTGGPVYAANIEGTLSFQANTAMPVPAPATAALALLGLLAMGCCTRRRDG